MTPHLGQKIEPDRNVLWCGTFQLAWNELCDLAGGDVRMENATPMLAALNRRTSSKADVDEASYVAFAGLGRDEVVERAARQLDARSARRTQGEILRYIATPAPGDLFVYACLVKQLPFKWRFSRSEGGGLDFGGQPVECFGILQYLPGEKGQARMGEQVAILDYRTNDDFILELKTRSRDDRLILAKVTPLETLQETIEAVHRRIATSAPGKLEELETVAIPVLCIDILASYSELTGRRLAAPGKGIDGTVIQAAAQTIHFRLDESGAVLVSEAIIDVFGGAKREFTFDKPFLVLLERVGAKNPYFALWVGNSELLQVKAEKPPAKNEPTEKPADIF